MFPTDFLAIGLGTTELAIIVVIILVLFGGTKIPQLMRGVGKGVSELRKGLDEGKRDLERAIHDDDDKKSDDDSVRK
jgi:sec-independent protein translocase protein TatA